MTRIAQQARQNRRLRHALVGAAGCGVLVAVSVTDLERLATTVAALEAELVVIDGTVSPIQQRNLEKGLGAKVVDRSTRRALLTGVRSFPFRNYVPTKGLPLGPGWIPILDHQPIVTEVLGEAEALVESGELDEAERDQDSQGS